VRRVPSATAPGLPPGAQALLDDIQARLTVVQTELQSGHIQRQVLRTELLGIRTDLHGLLEAGLSAGMVQPGLRAVKSELRSLQPGHSSLTALRANAATLSTDVAALRAAPASDSGGSVSSTDAGGRGEDDQEGHETSSLRTDFQALQTDLKALQADLQATTLDPNALQADLKALQADLNALQADVANQSGNDHQADDDEDSGGQGGSQALQTDLQALQADLNTLQTDLQANPLNPATLQADLKALQADAKALRADVGDHGDDEDEQAPGVQGDLQAVRTDLNKLQTDLQANPLDPAALQADLKALQSDLKALQADLRAGGDTQDDHEGDEGQGGGQAVQKDLTALQTDLNTLQTDLEANPLNPTKLQADLKALQTDVQSLQTDLQPGGHHEGDRGD
jgi:peptidoglycan hydrolase CwlO-like protein